MSTTDLRVSPARAGNQGASEFAILLRESLRQIDNNGTLAPDSVRALRKAIGTAAVPHLHDIAFEPDRHLGAFDDLPQAAREAIVAAIVASDSWGLRGYRFAPLHALLLRFLWRIKLGTDRMTGESGGLAGMVRGCADVLAYGARKAPLSVIRAVNHRRCARRARTANDVGLLDMLMLADISPQSLAVCYARDVPQSPHSRAYWHDPQRCITVGRVLGLDLLPADGGYWYIESNAHPSLDSGRSGLYERDPFCMNMVQFAAAHDYRHLMVLDNSSSGIDPKMAESYAAEAARSGIGLSLPTMPNVPGHAELRSYGIPGEVPDDTLVIRIRPFPVSIDHMLDSKRAAHRMLSTYLAENRDPALRLPVTTTEPVLGDVDPDEPFPNVVYKLPEIEQGRGVWFLKARSAEHAREILAEALTGPRRRTLDERFLYAVTNKEGVYQPFIRPRMVDGRLYKIRALIMITPLGVRLLSAHRIIAAHRVPASLEHGVVRDPGPYMVNSALGGTKGIPPAEEEDDIRQSAEAIGRGFAWGLERAFRIGPG